MSNNVGINIKRIKYWCQNVCGLKRLFTITNIIPRANDTNL